MKKKKAIPLERKNISFNIRDDFYKRLCYIVLSIIPLWILAEEKPPLSYIALIFFLIISFNMLILIKSSQIIIDDFLPPKIIHEKKTKPFDKFIYNFSNILFVSSLIILLPTIGYIDNTIFGMKLFWNVGLIGLISAMILILMVKKTNPTVFYESNRRYTVVLGLSLGFFLLFPSFASFINYFYADENTNCKTYFIERKSIGGKRNIHWLFFKLDNNEEERFEVSREIYDKVDLGEEIKLCTKKGKLGYDFITNIRDLN